jgi:hypothetical protein
MLVAADKFTKWVEAAPVTTQDSTAAINFIKSIVFRFGVPYSIITDNGTNFTSELLRRTRNHAQICICGTPEDKWASRKSQWPDMQWDKKEALSTSRENQERLGR